MGNIKNFNFNKLDLKLSNSDYWDFYLATDEYNSCGYNQTCEPVVWYDFNDVASYSNSATTATSIVSLVSWSEAVNTGYTFNTIGLTGIDNGLITFDKTSGDTTNQALLNAITGSTLIIPSGDTRLHMTRVTGTTGNFIYPLSHKVDTTFTTGDTASFCGGFYQGYYKIDGSSYQVLPTRPNEAWVAEFWLKPSSGDCATVTGTTLNDYYPDNKGIFFYMGTRAENKYWNTFNGVDSGCTSGCTSPSGCTDTLSPWCTLPRETDIVLTGGTLGANIPLSPPLIHSELITNNFLIFGRANSKSPRNHDGLGVKTICDYDGKGIVVSTKSQEITNTTNPFLVYGRASKDKSACQCNKCNGPGDGLGNETICSFSGFSKDQDTLDYKIDIIDNALAFRIKDDGSIGYRLLTVTGTCITGTTQKTYVSGVTVEEAYSVSGMVKTDEWSYIAIRFVMPYLDDCDLKIKKPRKGKLMFYVNSRLKFVVNEFDEVVGRRINDSFLKQVGVPFNFSLGGGSQGLLESQTFDGLDMADRNLPIEKNFAGSFIGEISQFKFNICDLPFSNIQYNYIKDVRRYGVSIEEYLIMEDGFLMLQDNGYGFTWK